MNANDILVVGIGQAGNNLAEEMVKQNRRITGVCINSSRDDMSELEYIEDTVVLPATGGAGKNRDTAKAFLRKHAPLVVDKIKDYNMKKHVFIAFSMGGGTGSGMATILLNLLSRTEPDKIFHLIPILPFEKESMQTQQNTIECWNELMKLKDLNIGAIYLLDNSKRAKKQTINREFAQLFNMYLNTTKAHVDGVIDKEELRILGTTKGLTGIYDIRRYIDTPEKIYDECIVKDSIFALGSKSIQYIGLSVPKEFDNEYIIEQLKPQAGYFEGINDENPILMLSGVNPTGKAIENVVDIYQYKAETLAVNRAEFEKEEQDAFVDIVLEKKPVEKKRVIKEEERIDDILDCGDSFWDDIMNM